MQMSIRLLYAANILEESWHYTLGEILGTEGRAHDGHAVGRHHAPPPHARVATHHRLLLHHTRVAAHHVLARVLPHVLHALHGLHWLLGSLQRLRRLLIPDLGVGERVVAHGTDAHAGHVEHGIPRQVLLVYDGAPQPRADEDEAEQPVEHAKADSERRGQGVGFFAQCRDALHEQEAPDDTEGPEEVERHEHNAPLDGDVVRILQDENLHGHVKDGRKSARERRRDKPGCDDGKESFLVEIPDHALPAKGGNANAEHRAHHRVSRRHGHREESGNQNPATGADVDK
mmetsp:Transcript_79619/g.129056  ORF Transcript_79619/g.129056 Transcript_79619/m.129056 type:complete len:287 (+) Transcript_79619:648-1508(+)